MFRVSTPLLGVTKRVIRQGNGPKPARGQTLTVHCTGKLENGKKFWSTKDPGENKFTFQVGTGSVIKGWDEGCMGMELGEIAELTCTGDYAYGPRGFAAWGIGPNATLSFEIELVNIK